MTPMRESGTEMHDWLGGQHFYRFKKIKLNSL
jgi:hypothetical protein